MLPTVDMPMSPQIILNSPASIHPLPALSHLGKGESRRKEIIEYIIVVDFREIVGENQGNRNLPMKDQYTPIIMTVGHLVNSSLNTVTSSGDNLLSTLILFFFSTPIMKRLTQI